MPARPDPTGPAASSFRRLLLVPQGSALVRVCVCVWVFRLMYVQRDCCGLMPRGLLQPYPLHCPYARTIPTHLPMHRTHHFTTRSFPKAYAVPGLRLVHLPPGADDLHFRERQRKLVSECV